MIADDKNRFVCGVVVEYQRWVLNQLCTDLPLVFRRVRRVLAEIIPVRICQGVKLILSVYSDFARLVLAKSVHSQLYSFSVR
jgi:hypothetical protein